MIVNVKYIAVLCFLIFCLPVFAAKGEVNQEKINEMIQKSGDVSLSLEERIVLLDSALSLYKDTLQASYYSTIVRKAETYFKEARYYEAAQITGTYLAKLPLLKSDEISEAMKKVHTDLLFWCGYSLAYMGYYDNAMKQFSEIFSLYGENRDSYYYAKACRGIGVVHGMRSESEKARKYFNEHLRVSELLKDYEGITGSLSNLGVLQLQNHQPDSALIILLEANKIAILHKEICEEERILYLIGVAYCSSNQVELGNKYLQAATVVAEKKGSRFLILYIQNSRIHQLMSSGQLQQAKEACLEHYHLARKYKAKDLELNALELLANIYGQEGKYKDAYESLKESYAINDSLYKRGRGERSEIIGGILEEQQWREVQAKNQQDMEHFRWEIKWRNIGLVLLFLIVVVLAAALIRLFNCRRIERQSLKRHSEEQISFDQVDIKGNSGDKEQLMNFLVQANNNDTVAEILERVQVVKQNFSSAGKSSHVIAEIEELLGRLEGEKDWGMFQYYFEQTNEVFFRKLSEACPILTSGDRRLCTLISLNLTTKEIASLVNRSVRGVETAKFRLKKKIGLRFDESLTDFINRLKSG